MNQALPFIVAPLLAYLLGATPFGFIIGKMRGIDIRTCGSGNIGATNVFRVLGKGLGITTSLLDIGKGVAGVLLVPLLAGVWWPDAAEGIPLRLCCGVAVVAGHNWPFWLKFKGGKGIATSAGIMIGLAPLAVLVGFAIWLMVFLASGYVSLASITAAVALAIAGWLMYGAQDWLLPGVLTLLSALAILRHKSNIARLIAGTENRFSFKKGKTI